MKQKQLTCGLTLETLDVENQSLCMCSNSHVN